VISLQSIVEAEQHAAEEQAAKKAKAAAAKKHAEEVAAANRKQEEEAVAKKREQELAAQIRALLAGELTPSGKAAKIASLLKGKGFTVTFKALEAGTAVIAWYEVPAGAKLAEKPKPVLVAAGQRTFLAAGTAKIKIKLTSAGKRLLNHARKLKLTSKGTFTPTGKTPVTATKVFVLKY
jgi:predicted ArsR family transcriptional regulator